MLVWAVTAHGRVMFRTEVSSVCPEGQRWSSIPTPAGCEVSQISVGPTGLVWAVLWNGKALVRTGITRACLTGEAWEEVSQPGDNLLLSQVSVGYNGLWAITRDNRVWFRKGINGDNCGVSAELAKGTGWVEMIGNMSSISVASNDQVWAVGAEDRLLYFRTAVTPDDLTGKTWRLIGAPTQLSRTSSTASLFSSGQSGGTPREKRHRSWTSLNRHSGSHENQPRIDLDLNETCHSAPAGSRNLWQKSTDGTSLTSYGSSDSGGLACSLQETTLEDLPHPSEIVEERPRDHEKENVYENSSHPVLGFSSKEITRPARSWSPQSSSGTVVATEAHSAIGSLVFESDELAGIYSEHGEREEEDDDLYWADSEAFWATIEAGACLVNLNHLPNWFAENGNSVKTDLVKPWRIKILDELKMRPGEVNDLDKYEQAIDTSSWVKSANEKCLLPNSTFYQDCVLELEWVSGGKGSLDCGTLTISSLDKMSTLDQISMNDVISVMCSSIPGSPRISIFKSNMSVPLRIQFKAENDLEDWMTELSSVCCRVRNISSVPAPNSIWMTSALGDIFVCDLEHIGMEQQCDNSKEYAIELPLPTPSVPFETPLFSGFLPGSSVIIKGCVPAKADRFTIDFKCCNENGRSDIAFHFNPRIIDDIVVRNAKKDGVWGPEDRRGCQPFTAGAIFELKIVADRKCFRIYVNDQKYVDFALRESFSDEDDLKLTFPYITHLACSGDVVVNNVKYFTLDFILPPYIMYWRQIPGHLRKVESAGGITWGIGFDNTAWVYMGRNERGGNKNYKMSDSHCYYVYENQRWNPLTGYTSHGLPTDRFMWSDASGKHKRKREKTNLLSKKWHWANEWAVDYHTPGGVDKEGWQYAVDFPSAYHGKKHLTDYVRRRRWVRKARLDTEGPWTELGHTSLSDCSLHVDGDQIVAWAVASNGYVLFRRGLSVSCPSGLSWEHVPSDHQIVSISSGPGKLWAVSKSGAAFWRFGITPTNPIGEAWNTVEAPVGTTLKQISVGAAGVWALDSNGRLSVRREETGAFPEGTHWETLPLYSPDQVFHEEYSLANTPVTSASGGFRYVSAKSRLWAITWTGQLVYRLGISPQNPGGCMWIPGIESNSLHIS
ncbi:UNVERIFIED_CONTAM: hypothetical protein PYX00_005559 [Menopon gallinae]|uniref:Galectin domain-containing protein n=1 Tax=Menopon gallinae TaxID=328185 RepID=A0AAW2HSC6_9NEOP